MFKVPRNPPGGEFAGGGEIREYRQPGAAPPELPEEAPGTREQGRAGCEFHPVAVDDPFDELPGTADRRVPVLRQELGLLGLDRERCIDVGFVCRGRLGGRAEAAADGGEVADQADVG